MAARTVDRTGPVELVVSGMTCGSCATRVQKALSRHEGVEDAAGSATRRKASSKIEPVGRQAS